jgi:hypothetical protein
LLTREAQILCVLGQDAGSQSAGLTCHLECRTAGLVGRHGQGGVDRAQGSTARRRDEVAPAGVRERQASDPGADGDGFAEAGSILGGEAGLALDVVLALAVLVQAHEPLIGLAQPGPPVMPAFAQETGTGEDAAGLLTPLPLWPVKDQAERVQAIE